jgi:hypothetical protein
MTVSPVRTVFEPVRSRDGADDQVTVRTELPFGPGTKATTVGHR